MAERAEIEAVADIIFRVFCRTTTYNRVSREWAIEAAGEVLGRVRDARGDDEVRIVERDAPLLEVVRGPYAKASRRIAELEAQLEAARSPQGEDHETSVPRQSDAPTERNRERPDDPVGTGEGHSPPQGEDHEAGIEAAHEALGHWDGWRAFDADMVPDLIGWMVETSIGAYLSRVSPQGDDHETDAGGSDADAR